MGNNPGPGGADHAIVKINAGLCAAIGKLLQAEGQTLADSGCPDVGGKMVRLGTIILYLSEFPRDNATARWRPLATLIGDFAVIPGFEYMLSVRDALRVATWECDPNSLGANYRDEQDGWHVLYRFTNPNDEFASEPFPGQVFENHKDPNPEKG